MANNKSIEELDSNFKAAQNTEVLVWRDIRELGLEGQGWPEESDAFCRLPNRAQGVVREAVWDLSRHSAGIAARFVSDASKIAARWTLRSENLAMPHMPATGVSGLDLYARDGEKWRWASAGRPTQVENEAVLLDKIAPTAREFRLCLPLYNGVSGVEIGVPEGASLEKAPTAHKKPLCFYGTSIVQGGCASRPGMAYPAIVSRWLDVPHWNLGFSGNGKSEIEIAQLLAELDAAAFVLDALPNMGPELVEERLGPFVRLLREARPMTPIVLMENITYTSAWIKPQTGVFYDRKNDVLRAVFVDLQAEGIENLHFVEGDALLGEDSEGTVDGVHPNDVGFLRMAERLLPVVRPLID